MADAPGSPTAGRGDGDHGNTVGLAIRRDGVKSNRNQDSTVGGASHPAADGAAGVRVSSVGTLGLHRQGRARRHRPRRAVASMGRHLTPPATATTGSSRTPRQPAPVDMMRNTNSRSRHACPPPVVARARPSTATTAPAAGTTSTAPRRVFLDSATNMCVHARDTPSCADEINASLRLEQRRHPQLPPARAYGVTCPPARHDNHGIIANFTADGAGGHGEDSTEEQHSKIDTSRTQPTIGASVVAPTWHRYRLAVSGKPTTRQRPPAPTRATLPRVM